jgi:predicted aconitase with swiveling domain
MISKGKTSGKSIVTKDAISFLGGVDPKTGIVIDKKHELYNQCITDKILVIPSGKGSTVGSYVIYQMIKNNTAPKAIICQNAEPIIAIGAIISKIPMVDNPEVDIVNSLENDVDVTVDADNSLITFN